MKKIIVCIFIIQFLNSSAWGAVYPEGMSSFRLASGYSTAPGLWKGANFSNFAGDGKTEDYALQWTSSMGLRKGLQLDLTGEYRDRKYVGGSAEVGGSINPGDSTQSVPNIGFRLSKQLMNKSDGFDLVGFFGVRAPGDDKRTGNFLDGTDGVTKYDLGLSASCSWSFLTPSLSVNYIHRPGEHDDQLSLNASFSFSVRSWALGLMGNHFMTFSGNDIGTPGFVASGMNFSLNKEEYTSLGFFIGRFITDKLSIDANFYQKVSGRNTDKAMGMGLGLTLYY